jgi:hypothetical protein
MTTNTTTLGADAAAISMLGMRHLLQERRDWAPTVESAEILLAMSQVGLGSHLLAQSGVERFAAAQHRDGESLGSWGGDFDTTAHGLMLAAAYPGLIDANQARLGADFLLKTFGDTSLGWSWSDEIPKTLLALRALLAVRHPRVGEVARLALPWLLNYQHDLILVNERYTAEFLAVHREVAEMIGIDGIPERVREEVPEMQVALIRSCYEQLGTSGKLWNNDPRANGIALEMIASSLATEDPAMLRKVLAWFSGRQRPDGSFGTALETARVVQGLAQFADSLARARGLDHDAARASVRSAHQGLAEAIPMTVLWRSLRWVHDEARQARILIVPDRAWRWVVGTVSFIAVALLSSWVPELVKTWMRR